MIYLFGGGELVVKCCDSSKCCEQFNGWRGFRFCMLLLLQLLGGSAITASGVTSCALRIACSPTRQLVSTSVTTVGINLSLVEDNFSRHLKKRLSAGVALTKRSLSLESVVNGLSSRKSMRSLSRRPSVTFNQLQGSRERQMPPLFEQLCYPIALY